MCEYYFSGLTSQLSDITSCVGDTITRYCTVDSFTHIWTIDSFNSGGESAVSSGTQQDMVMMGFTFRLEEVGSTAIISSVTGTLTAELNNTAISCRDGFRQLGQAETQQFTATVLSKCNANEHTGA